MRTETPRLTLPDPSHPLVVFGGAYSNLRATKRLREVIEERAIPPQNVVCTGDVVAYCAEPVETATLVRDWGCHVIQGNCEQQLAAGAADCGCNFEEGTACDLLAKGWYPFANRQMTPELRKWMADLPETLTFSFSGLTFRVVHGGADETAKWVFPSQSELIESELDAARTDVVLAGHCGVPFIAEVGRRVWFNSGALGMPANDGTADVWYGLVTPVGERSVRLTTHRLTYDHASAAAAMRRFGHANPYARTLVTGLWPSLDVFPQAEKAAAGRRIPERARTTGARRRASPTDSARLLG
jgi:predicted phosphodiesterase